LRGEWTACLIVGGLGSMRTARHITTRGTRYYVLL